MRRNSSLISQDADVFEDTSVSRVQVYVRIRPIVQGDVTSITRKGAVSVEATDLTQVRVADGKKEKIFQFDQVLPPEASNAEVYQVVGKPLVEASMTGLNSILMAYGQTGAGKTHTLMASADGLTTSVVSHIFALIGKDAAHSYAVTCSYLQIYQERVYDLLASEKSGTEVFLREHPKKGVYVENLSEYSVKSPEEIVRLLKSGKRRLAVAETKMNRQSSRSHAVCLLKIERLSVPRRYGGITDSLSSYESYYMSGNSDADASSDSGSLDALSSYHYDEDEELLRRITSKTRGLAAVRGKLYVCDLAGSERVKKTKAAGERLQEAQSINSSLLELGNVIQALAEGIRRHIPYRNSVLTRLLQDGLDGNSKTSLIVCVSPSFRDVNETLCSLKFGLRAMKIHNVAQVNVNEIDFEKMAKQLSETLEGREREWRKQKSEYESYIMTLEAERDARSRHDGMVKINSDSLDPAEKAHLPVTLVNESLKNQTKAVLLAELVSMELFYGLEDLLKAGPTGMAHGFTSPKLYSSLTDRDLLLQSAETLLELTEYFFMKSTLSDDDNNTNTALRKFEVQEQTTEKPYRFMAQGQGTRHSTPSNESSYERKLLRVRERLRRLKRTTDSAALGFLSNFLDAKLEEKEKGLQDYKKRLYDLLKLLVTSQDSSADDDRIDSLRLEQSLCHVLMDKALLNCILLLDKADMEFKMKTLAVHQSHFDYSGIISMTPIQFDCSSQSSDDFVPSPPLSGTGRLTSVDEGVVLESSSDSTNSREKLTSHLENATEELEAENKRLYERNEELRKRHLQAEEEKSELTLKVLELERNLERNERKLHSYRQLETTDVIDLQDKVEEKEFETCELLARVEELEDELQAKVQATSLLKENERQLRGQLSEERKHFEDLEERNAKLKLKFKHLEDRFEENELKLASYTKSESLDSNKVMKQLESLIAENKTLNLRIFQLQGEQTEKSDISSAIQNETRDLKFTEDQKKNLERKIIDLEVKLKEQQVKILSVKEYERRLRAELCKEMTKKLTKAQTRSRELGEKILALEAKLRDAEQQYNTVQGLDLNTRSAMLDDIRALKDKLQYSESRNKELNLSVQDAEERLRLSQREVLLVKQSEIDLREKVQLLESENCRIQDKLRTSKEERTTRPPTGRTADRLEKLRKENANLSLELKSFRENILKLESDLLRKDQEILTLRNESVDLSSEVCKLRNELDESVKNKTDELKKSSEAQAKLASRLALLERELTELRRSKTQETDRVVEVVDGRSDSTGSTLLISDVNFELAVNSESSESFLEKPENSEFVGDSQMDRKQLLKEQKQLQIVIGELQNEKSRMADRNEKLLQDLKTLEAKLSIIESAFRLCRSENECLQQEVNIKAAEANTVRTYASFCSEKANELRSEMAAHRENEACLEKRLSDLEKESVQVRNEMGHGMLEMSELKERKESLEKKIVDASRVVDHLKQEIVGLVNGMLTLQRELIVHIDKMLDCLGLDEKSVQRFRVRQLSADSNDISTQTEESGSEVSSELSEVFLSSSPFPFRLLPDKEGFLNPSDVSVIRENKTEILRLQDELKAKVLAIKDFLNSNKGSVAKVDDERGGEVHAKAALGILAFGPKNTSGLPRLSKAERVKLSSLLSRLKEELVRERKTNNDGRSSGDGNDLCVLYDNLESKLSRLSCELATKENEITDLLSERTQLQNELEECEKGLSVCRHCNCKVSQELEEKRKRLEGSLLSQAQDTSRLESEICEFMEYRQRLEGELDLIKGQITNLEDELDVRKILIERCIGPRPEGGEREITNSDSSKDETDDFKPSLPGKKRKSQKRVTFENIDSSETVEKSFNKRRRQKSDILNGQESEEFHLNPNRWKESDMNASDIDLCELLASIPRDLPKKAPTPEELEISNMANRLSGYDNMSFEDKIEYATIIRKSEATGPEGSNDAQRVLINGVDKHDKGSNEDGRADHDDDGQVTCQMCGLFRKRS